MDFEVWPEAIELGRLFAEQGYELALVGGPVRDLLLHRKSHDLDFCSSARPEQFEPILRRWGHDGFWDMGRKFGTLGAMRRRPDGTEVKVEVTTYRSDTYDPDSRKPEVNYGDTLEGDLSRRDFTVNAMALRVPDLQFVDPFGGASDLSKGVLRTPVDPRQSFDDDPLRMMRAVRFVASWASVSRRTRPRRLPRCATASTSYPPSPCARRTDQTAALRPSARRP